MDLTFTTGRRVSRSEARRWLEANRPGESLAPMGTAAGLEQHRRWERMLYDAGRAAASWPVQYGARELTAPNG